MLEEYCATAHTFALYLLRDLSLTSSITDLSEVTGMCCVWVCGYERVRATDRSVWGPIMRRATASLY